ncbi:MAG: hypothetical protein HY553_14585 [Elusimicrobia bacterium]|nr:hypothetical protein [Elusimicrobiota bacterium]
MSAASDEPIPHAEAYLRRLRNMIARGIAPELAVYILILELGWTWRQPRDGKGG